MGLWLGLDYGRVRIGVARSDALGITVHAVGWIERRDDAQAAATVAALAARLGAAGIALGMPRHADGRFGENARWVQRFRARLAGALSLPIALVDERDSTAEAEEELRRRGRWPCAPGWLDAEAAAVILRRHLARPGLTRGAASSPGA